MKNKKGVSMIALVITIIVVIIIAAVIMIVSGNTVSKAGVSKFKQEISDYDYEVKATAKQVKMEEVLGRDVITERESFFSTATGLEPTDDDEMYARFRTEIDRMILPDDLKDDVFYQILTTTKVSAKQTMRDQIYYVTEGGEVFVLPGYYEKQDNNTTVWWINANLYYESEFPFELPNTITPPKPKPPTPTVTVTENDMSGTEVVSNGVTKENVYVLVKAKTEGDIINVAVIKDGSPYSVTQDGNGGFSLTEEGEFVIVATSKNDEGTNSDEVKYKVTINRVAPGAPTITANIESVAGAAIETNGLTNKNVAVTITKSADAESTPLIMTKNDVEILSVENAEDGYMLSEDGVYVITTKSLDKLKNESSPATFVVTIDKVAPSAPTIVAMMGETAILNDGVAGQDVTITVTPASDANKTEVIIKKDGVELSKSSTLSRKLTDEGVYTITATSEDLAKNKSSQSIFVVTIDKAGPDAPVITGMVDGSDFASGGETMKNVAITVTPSLEANTTEVVITKDDAEISRSGALSYNLTDSGKYVVSVVSQDIYGNSSSIVTYEVTIKSKIVPTVTAPTAKTLTANGTDQELVNAGSTTGGTLQYALSTSTTNNGTYGTSIPKAKDAGTYYVFYKVAGNDTYEDITESYVTVTITSLDVTAKTGLVYNGKSQTIATSKGSNLKFIVNTDGKTPKSGDFPIFGDGSTNLSQKNAGTYYVFYKTKSGDVFGPVVCTIEKANGSGSVTLSDWTEGKTASTPKPTSDTNGTNNVTYKYKLASDPDSSYTSTKPSVIGNYTVQATFAATNNYKEVTATANFKIISKEDDPSSYIKVEGVKVVCTGGNMGKISRIEEGEIYYSPTTGNYYYALRDTNTGIGTLLVEVLKVGGYVLDIDTDGFVSEDKAEEGDLVKNADGSVKLCIAVETKNVGNIIKPKYETQRTFVPLEIEA